MKIRNMSVAAKWMIGLLLSAAGGVPAADLAPGVRGVATRAPSQMKIDGDLVEFAQAFGTPLEYFHADWKNRAAQFFYMWDDEAFYAGLRTLDEKQANPAPDDRLWEGDAVEWYFDTRRGPGFRNTKWESGAVHCYWTGYQGKDLSPRFCLRPGYLDAIPKIGVEVAARKTAKGAEVEFKLPWANFSEFKPREGEVIALDAELCYSDGERRVYRSFVFGSPLSVSQPASLAQVQLVDKLETGHWKACGPVMMPLRVDTPWNQPATKAHVFGSIALPPHQADQVGRVVFRLTSLDGRNLGEYEAQREVLDADGHFFRANANWPSDAAPPGGHHVHAVVFDKQGQELTRVAPRLVSVNMQIGY
jgi:hypothetical protein